MKIKFILAKKKNFKEFLAYFKKNLAEDFPLYSPKSISYTVEWNYSPKWLIDKLNKGFKKVIIALDDRKIVGYLMFQKHIAGVAFADWLAVQRNYRKKGIASKLIDLWQGDSFGQGAHALQLWTTKGNIEFYKNRGFILAGLFPKAWHGHDSYLLYKHFREPEEKNYLKQYLDSKRK